MFLSFIISLSDYLQLIHSKDLPHLTVKVKEPVLREPWAIKACILIHAHFGKVPLPPATLRPGESKLQVLMKFSRKCGLSLSPDQRTVLKLCPRLVNEMISILNQVWIYARYRPSELPLPSHSGILISAVCSSSLPLQVRRCPQPPVRMCTRVS